MRFLTGGGDFPLVEVFLVVTATGHLVCRDNGRDRQPPTAKSYPAQNVSSAVITMLWTTSVTKNWFLLFCFYSHLLIKLTLPQGLFSLLPVHDFKKVLN